MRAPATNPPAPADSCHFVHFYEDRAFPADRIAAFIGAGLQSDLAGVVIATPAHREAVAAMLEARGIDVRAARTQGRLVELDAAATLSLFMGEDGPDAPRFHESMSALLVRAGRGAQGVRAFGEMVALLCARGRPDQAIRMEELWNELGRRARFSLYCAYPMSAFEGDADAARFLHVCELHAKTSVANEAWDRSGQDAHFRRLTELSPSDWYWEQDEAGRFTKISGRNLERAGISGPDIIGRTRWQLAGARADEAQKILLDRAVRERRSFYDFGYSFAGSDGVAHYVETSGEPVLDAAGRFCGYRGVARDVTERERHNRRQSLIAAFGQEALASTDLDAILSRAADIVAEGLEVGFSKVLQIGPDGHGLILKAGKGWDAGWVAGWVDRPLALDDEDSAKRTMLAARGPVIVHDFGNQPGFRRSTMLESHGIASAVNVQISTAAGAYGVLGAYSRERGAFNPSSSSFLQSIANIIGTAVERRNAERRLAYLAQFDALTGLPNRTLFHDRLEQTLMQSRRNNWHAAVVFLDLDRFRLTNDTYGHAAGDALLAEVGKRLSKCVRSGDTVAHLGSDEFAVVLSNLARNDDAGLAAQKMLAALRRPFDLEGREAFVTANLGIAMFPGDATQASTLLKYADVAMCRAKERGGNAFQFYLPEMHERSVERIELEAQLRSALERNEFVLHYQPKADLQSGAICGFEALLRWQHPERGLVAPAQFIPLLEDTGLIVPVGEWLLRTACAQLSLWRGMGRTPVPVAVNLSARQFQDQSLDGVIGEILKQTGADPCLLELELTESLLMKDPEQAAQTLRNLKRYGVRLSVDDFGTGYSSLAYLKRFPLDALKIDRAFIRDCIADPEDATIALAIINLAHSLKLKVVAEGVETVTQMNFLRSHGCDQIQGFLFAKPMDATAASGALREGLCLAVPGFPDLAPAVLLVDDNPDDLLIFRETLAPEGYRIVTAQTAKAALDILANDKIGLVISDQNMPAMHGVRFLAAVRNLYPGVIRAMLTGSDRADTLPDAVNEAGIHRFLSKHWEPARLREEVREAYRLSQRESTDAAE